jgi:hypothetical protein
MSAPATASGTLPTAGDEPAEGGILAQTGARTFDADIPSL